MSMKWKMLDVRGYGQTHVQPFAIHLYIRKLWHLDILHIHYLTCQLFFVEVLNTISNTYVNVQAQLLTSVAGWVDIRETWSLSNQSQNRPPPSWISQKNQSILRSVNQSILRSGNFRIFSTSIIFPCVPKRSARVVKIDPGLASTEPQTRQMASCLSLGIGVFGHEPRPLKLRNKHIHSIVDVW